MQQLGEAAELIGLRVAHIEPEELMGLHQPRDPIEVAPLEHGNAAPPKLTLRSLGLGPAEPAALLDQRLVDRADCH